MDSLVYHPAGLSTSWLCLGPSEYRLGSTVSQHRGVGIGGRGIRREGTAWVLASGLLLQHGGAILCEKPVGT